MAMSLDDKASADETRWSDWIGRYRHRLLREAASWPADAHEQGAAARIETMDAANPRFILRQHIAQQAIAAAEAGDFEAVRRLLVRLETPFSEHPADADWPSLPPDWSHDLVLT